MKDMWDKGRGTIPTHVPGLVDNRGERHGLSILTDEAVREIRAKYANGGRSQKSLGLEYGVARQTISDIVRRVKWPHVEG